MSKRRRFKQTQSLKDRLILFARNASKKASELPPGPAHDDLLRKARQAETASHIEEWVNSPGLQSPTK
jgi:hypothetical protein